MLNFSEKYNREHFNSFLNNIFPFEPINEPVKVSDKNIFKSIKKIGYVKFEEIVPIFEVEHISKNDPRIELTNKFFSIMSSFSIKKSLVIFFCSDSEKYRFSLIESSLVWMSDSKIKREFSSPKRLSYLLGVDAKIHTPYNQFKNKIKNYQDLKTRFDKEVVTNEFFENYKNQGITTDNKLTSVFTTKLAIFRCTNISPGSVPVISFAGTLLSEHPINKYCGVCPSDNLLKYSGSTDNFSATHFLLLSNNRA